MAEIGEFLRFVALPGALIAIYFCFIKVGHKVGESHNFHFNKTHAAGIGHVVLTNMKDRSTPVFALYAVQGQVAIPLIKFDDPVVLKSFESIKIDIPPVSEYWFNGKPFDFTRKPGGGHIDVEIYYSTIGKFKKCVPLSAPSPVAFIKRHNLALVTISSQLFNGRVYSPNVIYIIEYKVNGQWGDAFVAREGFILWDFLPNGIPGDILTDPQTIADTLLKSLPFIEQLSIMKTSGWNRHFANGRQFKSGTDDRPFWGNKDKPQNS